MPADRFTVKQGVIGLSRSVPPEIVRPSYAETGDPGPPSQQQVQTPETIESMRRSGALAAEILITAGESIRPGITTDEIDDIVHTATIEASAYPSPLNYRGFRKSVCTSINEVICHGIPDSRRLEAGEIVNVDVTVFREGVHGDTSATFGVGEIGDESEHLINTTRECLYRAIDVVKPGQPINVIGRAIQEHAEAEGLGVVREFIGHGVGPTFHTALQIPHYYEPMATTTIEEGMTFTIEPMITIGDPALTMWNDGWTVVTLSGLRSAQFEHTLVVKSDGAEILTRTDGGLTAATILP